MQPPWRTATAVARPPVRYSSRPGIHVFSGCGELRRRATSVIDAPPAEVSGSVYQLLCKPAIEPSCWESPIILPQKNPLSVESSALFLAVVDRTRKPLIGSANTVAR